MNLINFSKTQGIVVSVKTAFKPEVSRVDNSYYCYSYQITIENQSNFSVVLLRRHWKIWDSLNEPRQVDGEGVIGEQPQLAPGEIFTYTSFCDMHSEIGHMVGYFTFENINLRKEFKVDIPKFQLIFDGKLN